MLTLQKLASERSPGNHTPAHWSMSLSMCSIELQGTSDARQPHQKGRFSNYHSRCSLSVITFDQMTSSNSCCTYSAVSEGYPPCRHNQVYPKACMQQAFIRSANR